MRDRLSDAMVAYGEITMLPLRPRDGLALYVFPFFLF